MNEFDSRQLKKMREQILSYQKGDIGLQSLIGDLLFLRDALSKVEQEWEYEFTDRIVDLETAYCYALEKNAGKLESISQKIVDQTLPKFLSLIKQIEDDLV